MVLVGKVVGLEQGRAQIIAIGIGRAEAGQECRLMRIEDLGLCFGSLVLGLAFGVFEDVAFKERIVSISSFVKEARSLGMEFESSLKLLQGIVYLELFRIVDLFGDDLLGVEVDGRKCRLVED
jgi:hypothetical protein